MQVTHKISMDMLQPHQRAAINLMQGDSLSRVVECTLYAGSEPWSIPADATIRQVVFCKPDKLGGVYDTMPDNTSAVTVSGNVATAKIHPQMLTVPGAVRCEIRFLSVTGAQLSTFTFWIDVDPCADSCAASENYFHFQSLVGVYDAIAQINSDLDSLANGLSLLALKSYAATDIPYQNQDMLNPPTNVCEALDELVGRMASALTQGDVADLLAEGLDQKADIAHTHDIPLVWDDNICPSLLDFLRTISQAGRYTFDDGEYTYFYELVIADLDGTQLYGILKLFSSAEDYCETRFYRGNSAAGLYKVEYSVQDGTDGNTPVRGVDYWTEADKSAIVADCIAALPDASEVDY